MKKVKSYSFFLDKIKEDEELKKIIELQKLKIEVEDQKTVVEFKK